MSFVNLHSHSHYSLLDGLGSPKEIVLRAKELGLPAVALTDHGVSYGLIEFYNAAKEAGIKPILGCEFYVAHRSRFDKEAKVDVKPYHLTVLAENNEGYKNILKLVTKAHLEGFYYKPRVDYKILKAYSKGLIVLSGCMAGHLPRAILSGDEKEIDTVITEHIEIFGKENYFLELQDHPLVENQAIVNDKLKKLAKKYGLNMVLTFDSHYPRPDDTDAHDILLCIQTGTNVNEENRMRYTGDFSLKNLDEMKDVFSDCPEVFENTLKIADRCNVDFEFGVNLIPKFDTPQNEAADVYLKQLCLEGLQDRFGKEKIPKEYMDRLEYELKTVNEMGFDTYFLIVHDFVKYARDNKIVVGPGRGSAAGSILAWSLKITDLDPIEYGLFFERFLNPERISMPDIDIDFADNRRDEVLNYVIEKYGRDNVAQIITFGTMAPKAAIRDVGRALGYPYQEVDKLSKTVPPPILGKYAPLEKSIKEDPDLRNIYENNPRLKVLLDYAKRLEGTVRHAGTHACAVVISEKPLTEYTALQHGAKLGTEVVTQFSAKPLEQLGLLKMDFLGLKNLTVIEQTCKIIKRTRGEDVDIEKIPLDDKDTFRLLQKGDTTGVFQLESAGMRRYLMKLIPTKFDDIVAMGALYRPGPMEWIPTYIKGKHNPEKVKYLHKSFEEVLAPTYGVAVYQEQILRIAGDFAGFSLGEADLLRKAVGKKDPVLLVEQREKFVSGAVKNGHKETFAIKVFEDVIEPFAGYGFNKAHAVCYGLIAYRTAYLKAKYPIEFMTALLCSDAGNMDRVVLEIKECSEMGIDVLPPSVNESFSSFTVVDEKTIRFGLLAVKGVGECPIKEIIKVRDEGGPFKSLEDFAKRVPPHILNKKIIQSLAYSGALDDFGDRNQIAENYEEIASFGKYAYSSSSNGQTDIFGVLGDDAGESANLVLRAVPLSTHIQRLRWEKELLGIYVSGHPLRALKRYIKKKGNLIGDLTDKSLGKKVHILGIVDDFRKILTRSGTYMVTFSLEDPTAKVSAIIFPKYLSQMKEPIVNDCIIGVTGKLDFRMGQYQIICENVKALSIDAMTRNAKESNLCDKDDSSSIAIRNLNDILADKKSELEEEHEANAGNIENVLEDAVETPFVIEMPGVLDESRMQNLKELLLSHRGKTPVEIYLRGDDQRIKLPFGVDLTGDLKKSVDSLLLAS
jgi:DNA polymerase III subunit alpha